MEDISVSGIRLALSKNLLLEVFSNISLAVGGILNFNVGAQVAWQNEYEGRNTYGLYFNRIDDTDRNRISQYIRENSFKDLRDQWWKGL
ncbi:MAG: hypothetical protein COT38_05255 [Candidatus Omnitrophica bacterium CG08_land_8_20_14_0_20_41_16]|nr:MAG: hypothetical protein COT38_05255 [Candidatus Omnitrophica bacterium CG08_land_8_20_14_0_20_41_16]